jgi:hypothetical protein
MAASDDNGFVVLGRPAAMTFESESAPSWAPLLVSPSMDHPAGRSRCVIPPCPSWRGWVGFGGGGVDAGLALPGGDRRQR